VSISAVWRGGSATINQGRGYNLGYLNSRLYREIGPEGVFHTITREQPHALAGSFQQGAAKGRDRLRGRWRKIDESTDHGHVERERHVPFCILV